MAFATLFRFEACFTRDIVAPPYLWERFDSSRCNITLGDRAAQATNALFRIQFLFILMNDIDVIYAMLPQADLRVATASRKQTQQVQCICGSAVQTDSVVGMVDRQGCFVWYELLTTDVAAAKAFYRDVIGWESQDATTPAFTYSLFMSSSGAVAGLMDLPEEGRRMGATPRWVGYVAVDDIDATADRVRKLGGRIYVPPTDSNIGRLSIVADAQAADFALVDGLKPERRATAPDAPGHVGWHELLAADGASAFAFYAELFGWKKAEAVGPKSAVESYQLFAADGVTMGGIFTKFARERVPFWLYYFNVADVAQAVARVRAGGGKVVQGPTELPDGSWIVRCIDPQDTMFALQGKSSQRGAEQPAAEIGWSTKWGDFASRGRMIVRPEAKPNTKPKPQR